MKKSVKLLVCMCIIIIIIIMRANECMCIIVSEDNGFGEITLYLEDRINKNYKGWLTELRELETNILKGWKKTIEEADFGKKFGYDPAYIYTAYYEIEKILVERSVHIDIEYWKPTAQSNNKLKSLAENFLGIIQIVGSVSSVIALVLIGIKYMFGSVSEKAKYKETMIPYVVGCIMLFSISNIASVIYKFAIEL